MITGGPLGKEGSICIAQHLRHWGFFLDLLGKNWAAITSLVSHFRMERNAHGTPSLVGQPALSLQAVQVHVPTGPNSVAAA